MRKAFFIQALSVILLFTSGCQESETISPRRYPIIETLQIGGIDENGVTIDVKLIHPGPQTIDSYGADYLETRLAPNNNIEVPLLTKEINGAPGESEFSVRIESDLLEGEEYFVKPFVRSGSYKVYGSALVFHAKGSRTPQITEVNSSVLGMRLEFVIRGENFSNRIENNLVEVPGTGDTFHFEIVEAQWDMLRVRVFQIGLGAGIDPNSRFDLSVTSMGKTSVLKDHFSVGFPRITGMNTLKAKPGDELLVDIELEEESEFMYLTINYNKGVYLLLRLTKISDGLYRTVMEEFPDGIYQLGFLKEGHHDVYSEKFEVVHE